jgi:hypothetical protein
MTRLLLAFVLVLLAGNPRCRSGSDTYPEQRIAIRGVLAGDEGDCPTLRDHNGVVYALVGDTGQYKRGDRVCVKGWRLESSECARANVVKVDWIGLARWCP